MEEALENLAVNNDLSREIYIRDIMTYDISTLVTCVIIVAVSVVGITEWIKSIKHCKNWHSPYIAFVTVLICSVMNTRLVGPMITTIWNVTMLSLAVSTVGYNVILRGIPDIINKFVDKATTQKIETP